MLLISLSELMLKLAKIRLIATDMDGTLTQKDKFTPKLLDTLTYLALDQIPVLIITGRSAGWTEGLFHYLPIVGVIAENGGVFYHLDHPSPQYLTPIKNLREHRQDLAYTFEILRSFYPHLQESSDNRYRLTDWTFSVETLNFQEIEHLKTLTEENGWSFTYSTVQCHIKPPHQDKATGLKQVLEKYFTHYTLDQVLTIGDSSNDEPLFNSALFPLSVGVANLLTYLDKLTYHPTYTTRQSEIDGFGEVIELLRQSKRT